MGLKEDIDMIAADAAAIRAWAHGSESYTATLGPHQVRSPAKLIADNQTAINTGIVPDGAITTAKLADGAVTSAKLANGSVTVANLADGSVTVAKLADGPATSAPAPNATTAAIGTSLRYARQDHVHPHAAGSMFLAAYVQTRTQATYTAPVSGDGTEITPLTLTVTPRKAGNRMLLQWVVVGEVDNETVWLVSRNGVLLPNATNASNNRWAGIVASPYDANHATTPSIYTVRIIDENTLDTASTYRLLIRSSDANAKTLYLNRPVNSAGQDAYEAGLSTGTAMEIHV